MTPSDAPPTTRLERIRVEDDEQRQAVNELIGRDANETQTFIASQQAIVTGATADAPLFPYIPRIVLDREQFEGLGEPDAIEVVVSAAESEGA